MEEKELHNIVEGILDSSSYTIKDNNGVSYVELVDKVLIPRLYSDEDDRVSINIAIEGKVFPLYVDVLKSISYNGKIYFTEDDIDFSKLIKG